MLELLEETSTGRDAAEVAAHLGSALPELADALDNARRSGWARLVPWLEETVTRLSALGRLAGQASTGRPVAGGVARSLARKRNDAFTDLLEALEVPPSLPPRSPRRLDRSVETSFAADADTYPALLATFQPALESVLYTALGNAEATPQTGIEVHALRQAASVFGGNAPLKAVYKDGKLIRFDEWDPEPDEDGRIAHLDRVYPGIVADSHVLVARPRSEQFGPTVVTAVDSATVGSRSAYGLTGKITSLRLTEPWWDPRKRREETGEDDFDVLRATTVYCQSERLPLADAPLVDDVCDAEVELDRLYDGLRSGRWMILTGERADVPGTSGVRAAELVMLTGVSQRVKTIPVSDVDGEPVEQPLPGDALHTFVTFAKPLAHCYRRGTVVLHGNVVHATHGETRTEVLGGGDATRRLQVFTLRQRPLTWTSAPTTSGTASSLEVRVGDVAWHEAATIVELAPGTRGFLTRQDDAAATTVVFGDGVHGARLPTGAENVRATYRSGIGSPGNVRPDQISLLATRPLGVKAVTNPLRASGGADAESRDQARRERPARGDGAGPAGLDPGLRRLRAHLRRGRQGERHAADRRHPAAGARDDRRRR